MANIASLKPFTKGDKRINRKGRPRSFDQLRKLARSIGVEDVKGSEWTRIELILRAWASSKNPAAQEKFVQYAYGKVPDETKISGQLKTDATITLSAVDYRNGLDALKPTE